MSTTSLTVYRRSELEDAAAGCLHRLRALWYQGVDDSSDISLIGVAFAKAKHLYVMDLVDHRLPQDDEDARKALIEAVAITQLPAHLIPELHAVWELHTRHFALDISRFIAAEERAVVGQVSFSCDLVLGHPESNALEIVDDKSGHAPPPSEIELRGNFQARVYSHAAREKWPGWHSYHFTQYAVRYNKRVTVRFSQEDLDQVGDEIQASIATIELAKASNQWPAIPGPACKWCTLKCPVVDHELALPKRLTPDQAAKLGPWLLVAGKQLRSLTASLKEHVKEHGPVPVGGGVEWALRPSVSRSFPVDAILEAFKKLKIDRQATDVLAAGGDLTISASALKRVMKLYPELDSLLALSERQKTSYRFAAKKAGDDDEEED